MEIQEQLNIQAYFLSLQVIGLTLRSKNGLCSNIKIEIMVRQKDFMLPVLNTYLPILKIILSLQWKTKISRYLKSHYDLHKPEKKSYSVAMCKSGILHVYLHILKTYLCFANRLIERLWRVHRKLLSPERMSGPFLSLSVFHCLIQQCTGPLLYSSEHTWKPKQISSVVQR